MITASDRKMLSEIIAIARPENSLSAKIEALTDDQRAHYEEWKLRCDNWFARCKARHDDGNEPDARPYARTLQGFGPTLRSDILVALYGQQIAIPLTTSDDKAAQIWKDYCDAILR